jgi:hypothetical protein
MITDDGLTYLRETLPKAKQAQSLSAFYKFADQVKARTRFEDILQVAKKSLSQGHHKFIDMIKAATTFKEFLRAVYEQDVIDNKVNASEVDKYIASRL